MDSVQHLEAITSYQIFTEGTYLSRPADSSLYSVGCVPCVRGGPNTNGLSLAVSFLLNVLTNNRLLVVKREKVLRNSLHVLYSRRKVQPVLSLETQCAIWAT
ncbi:hypothetical protein TNCV_1967351 [Trichonephila clavipes]|nr:hypothetical protein TNCV_1967351 [Trichonephila clavipes]